MKSSPLRTRSDLVQHCHHWTLWRNLEEIEIPSEPRKHSELHVCDPLMGSTAKSTGLNWHFFPEFHNLNHGSGNRFGNDIDLSCLETVNICTKMSQIQCFYQGVLKYRKSSDIHLFWIEVWWAWQDKNKRENQTKYDHEIMKKGFAGSSPMV